MKYYFKILIVNIFFIVIISTVAKTEIKDSLMKDYIRCWTYYDVSVETAELSNLMEQSQIDQIKWNRNFMYKAIAKLAKEKNIKGDDLISSMTKEQEEHRNQNMLLKNFPEYSRKHREFCKTLSTLIIERK